MVAGGLSAIVFVCTLACWAVWSLVFFTFVAHYFLTTLTDSSSGQDEVYYPREGFFEWWWKPIFCVWILHFWLVPATLLLSPLGLLSPTAFLIAWLLVLWFAYPLSLASSLYAQHWLVFVHRGVIGRMLQHVGAFAYVHLITFALCAGSAWLVVRGLTDIFVWGALAVLLVPAAILLYARHWGRFAWLSLNFLPRQQKRPRVEKRREQTPHDDFPQTAARDADSPADGIREGLPPARSSGIKPGAPLNPSAIQAKPAAPAADEIDEWTDSTPYELLDDPTLLAFPKSPDTPPKPTVMPAAPVFTEEEDEWAPIKKPYDVSAEGAGVEAASADGPEEKSEADKPLVITKYWEERAQKEEEEKRKVEKAMRTMPARSKKTPTFRAAFFAGVWNFMLYPSTLLVWANLAVFTLVEFLLLYMLVMFWPKAP